MINQNLDVGRHARKQLQIVVRNPDHDVVCNDVLRVDRRPGPRRTHDALLAQLDAVYRLGQPGQ